MKNLLIKIGSILMIVLAICASYVQASVEDGYTFGINAARIDSSGNTYVYTFQSATNLKYIWNVQQYNEGIADTSKTFYCLAQGYGDFGNFDSTAQVGEIPVATGGISKSSYSGPYRLKDTGVVTTLKSLYENTEVTAFNEDRINGLVWLLDNMYIKGEEERGNFLNKIPCTDDGKVTGYEDYKLQELIEGLGINGTEAGLTDIDIEVAQQLAIWNITNNEVIGSFPTIYLSENGGTLKTYDMTFSTQLGGNISYGELREYCVKMIYNYLVNGAREAQNSGRSITKDMSTTISVYANAAAQPVVTITKEKEIPGKYTVRINKQNQQGVVLQGAVFTVNNKNYTTDKDGYATIVNDLAITKENVSIQDTYTMKEIKAPSGYVVYDGTIQLNVTKKLSDDGEEYVLNTVTLDETSQSSGKVKIEIDGNTITVIIIEDNIDLALRKFISKVVSSNGNTVYTDKELEDRIPEAITTNLRNGADTTGEYNHSKEPLKVRVGDKVTYTLRVYNEGQSDVYITEVTDYLSKYLKYVEDGEWSVENRSSQQDNYESKATTKANTTITGASSNLSNVVGKDLGSGVLLPAYDKTNNKLSYIDVQITCVALEPEDNTEEHKVTNIAEITGMLDKDGNIVEKDIDSSIRNVKLPENEQEWERYKDSEIETNPYIPGQQDDDDFEKLIIEGKFDLSLRKFITKVNTTSVNNRYPELSIDSNGNIKYTHTKTPLEVCTGDTVIYTIRVYNEGDIAGYANEITDNVPFGLEFIADNELNKEYRWVMLDENEQETNDVSKAKYLVTDYLSEDQEKVTGRNNLIQAFNKKLGLSDTNPDYRDVQIAFKVTYQVNAVGEESRILVNVAQISADSNDDIDSIPNRDEEYNDENHEDDIDYENVKVQYFDLSLLKWVTRAIVVENGDTRIIESGHTGYENPEPDLKVELKTSDVNKVIVKFAYTIKITNEGEIAGYAKEVSDYIPEGLTFNQEDNPDWYVRREGVVATAQLEDVLLQPGESAEVEIILTWINGEKNLGRKVNVAEISEDYNPSNTPDIDSTPDNQDPDEDDIDDAPVLIVIKTGTGINIQYTALATTVIMILGVGMIAIKKFVL